MAKPKLAKRLTRPPRAAPRPGLGDWALGHASALAETAAGYFDTSGAATGPCQPWSRGATVRLAKSSRTAPMKLFVSHTSPYARMARVVVREKGLSGRVEEVFVNPFDDPADLIEANPAGLIPALARGDGGRPIVDSRLICAWLDHLPSGAPALLPAGGPERLAARQAEALAQTLTDKSVAMVLEQRRPPERIHAPYLDRWRAQALRVAAALEEEIDRLPAGLSMGAVSMACALGHLDFRHADIAWREAAPRLGPWLDELTRRPSFAETAPRD